jgi:hypothetical protein
VFNAASGSSLPEAVVFASIIAPEADGKGVWFAPTTLVRHGTYVSSHPASGDISTSIEIFLDAQLIFQ